MKKNLVSIGGMLCHFELNTITDSLTCKIFRDIDSLKTLKIIIEDPSTTCVSDIGIIIHQLRQVRTHFHFSSTYTLRRVSGPMIMNYACYPFILFTLFENDHGRSPTTFIFRIISDEVLTHGNSTKLNKEKLTKCIKETTGNEKKNLNSVLDLYEDNIDSIPILSNVLLNK